MYSNTVVQTYLEFKLQNIIFPVYKITDLNILAPISPKPDPAFLVRNGPISNLRASVLHFDIEITFSDYFITFCLQFDSVTSVTCIGPARGVHKLSQYLFELLQYIDMHPPATA